MPIDETSYVMGNRQAWQHLLTLALTHLGYDKNEIKEISWVTEREDIINSLRSLCSDFGDNDWPNDLHLGDVIDKHLALHLRQGE